MNYRTLTTLFSAPAAVLVPCLLLTGGCSSEKKATEDTAAAKPRITQFYLNSAAVPKGEKALLCYGVDNAKEVTLDPPVEKVWPTLTRCFEINPDKATKYTLTATNDAGSVSQSVDVNVGAARPKLFDLSINATSVGAGQPISFCYKSSNAARVTGSPGKMKPSSASAGCLFDNPKQTTTYTLTAESADGLTATESVTVTVK